MNRAKPLPISLGDGPFTYASAIDAGASSGRLRAGDLGHPFRGRIARGEASSIPGLAATYAVGMGDDQYFSHLTAAALLELRMPQGFRSQALHVTSVAPRRAPRSRGVVGHQSNGCSIVELHGMRVSDPIETWIACASMVALDDLIVMGDGLIRRSNPLATASQLSVTVTSRAGIRGHRNLVLALSEMRPRTDSARETTLRLLLVRAGLPEPEVNGVITNKYGALIAHGDLVYRKYKTIIEYDGDHHRTDERQFAIDIDRLDELMEDGWRIIRVSKSLMARRATLLGRISTALKQGGWAGSTS